MRKSFAHFRITRHVACCGLAMGIALGGCASLPPPTAELDAARQAVARADAADADQYAAPQLAQARVALERAQAAMARGRDDEARAAAIAANADADLAQVMSRAAVTRAEYAQRQAEIQELRGRLRMEAVAFDGKVTFGVAGYRGRFDDDGKHTVFSYAADLTVAVPLGKGGGWISGPLELRIEAARFTADRTFTSGGAPTAPRGQGAFAQLSFHFFPPFLRDTFVGIGFDSPTFTLVALWDATAVQDPVTHRWNHQRRLSFGFNFRPIEQVAFKVEYVDEDSDEGWGNFQQDGVAASLAVGF